MAAEAISIQQKILASFCVTVLLAVMIFAAYLSGRTGQAATLVDVPPPPPSRIAPSYPVLREPVTADAKPVSGRMYLQMAAVDHAGADELTQELRSRGFQAVIGDGPSADVFRVLVGPLKDAAAISQTKAELESLGYACFPRKY
ncbi:MAG TPA: SPOR domain-containing protein [Bryobacteraceae bacterium]|nr:SPOR domain-containing protein [Bryobacteraceae bacterium]